MVGKRMTAEQVGELLGVSSEAVVRLAADGVLSEQAGAFDRDEVLQLRRSATHRMWRAVRALEGAAGGG